MSINVLNWKKKKEGESSLKKHLNKQSTERDKNKMFYFGNSIEITLQYLRLSKISSNLIR